MRKLSLAIMVIAPALLAACSGDPEAPEADAVTETQMDEVDVIDGTISDDMVDVDTQATSDAEAEQEGETTTGNDAQEASDEAEEAEE